MKKHKNEKHEALLPFAHKKFRQSHTLLCKMTRHYRSYMQRSLFWKLSGKPLHKNFRKTNTVREANGHNRVSVLILYLILPTETWNKTMFVMSGFQMVTKNDLPSD